MHVFTWQKCFKDDMFLLDEPTNRLDIQALVDDGIFTVTVNVILVVSHDRWFLNRICAHIAELSIRVFSN